MKDPEVPTTRANLIARSIHWSSRVQVHGNDEEMKHLGGSPMSRVRNRERRPIYIHRVLDDGRVLAMTCTTRHERGFYDVPRAYRQFYLPIDPAQPYKNERPTIKLATDDEGIFYGKSLIFLEVPVVSQLPFFRGFIGTVTADSAIVIDSHFYKMQVERLSRINLKDRLPPLSLTLSMLLAWREGCRSSEVVQAVNLLDEQEKRRYSRSDEAGKLFVGDRPHYTLGIVRDAPKDMRPRQPQIFGGKGYWGAGRKRLNGGGGGGGASPQVLREKPVNGGQNANVPPVASAGNKPVATTISKHSTKKPGPGPASKKRTRVKQPKPNNAGASEKQVHVKQPKPKNNASSSSRGIIAAPAAAPSVTMPVVQKGDEPRASAEVGGDKSSPRGGHGRRRRHNPKKNAEAVA